MCVKRPQREEQMTTSIRPSGTHPAHRRSMSALGLMIGLMLAFLHDADAQTLLVGSARVIDGDTLELQGERIRLHGLDAPESQQQCRDGQGQAYRCGQAATSALQQWIGDDEVRCVAQTKDRYERLIAICTVGHTHLNAQLVRHGLAVAYRRYSQDYVPHENCARAEQRGLWGGTFVMPWDWRRGQR